VLLSVGVLIAVIASYSGRFPPKSATDEKHY
jgi:hypothetical protein